jgi:hypothetical protein
LNPRVFATLPPPIREAAREALIPSLDTMLDLLRASLTAKKVTIASIPGWGAAFDTNNDYDY